MTERVVATAKKPEAKQTCSNSCKQNIGFNSSGSTADMILQLQRTAGNQAVQRLIKSGALQAKLKISQPNDIYEQEADRVAEQVMKMPELYAQRHPRKEKKEETIQPNTISERITPLTQRQMKKEEDDKLQTKWGMNQELSPDSASQIQSLRGRGHPLSEPIRTFFESRFAYNFSHVRVHTDSRAEEATRSVNAKAFTVGNEVVFGTGQYSPGTAGGRQLLAHELTHVIQQQGSKERMQRNVNATPELKSYSDQNNTEVCLVHLHADEENALAAAEEIYNRYRANLLRVNNPLKHRCLQVLGLGKNNKPCKADPNRIFSDKKVIVDCAFKAPCSCDESIKEKAAGELERWVGTFKNKVKECNKQDSLPVIAFHNNESFNILEYTRSGSDMWAAASTDEIKAALQPADMDEFVKNELGRNLDRNYMKIDGIEIKNPMGPKSKDKSEIKSSTFSRNFFVTTDIKDFLSLGVAGSNVVLQSRNPIDSSACAHKPDDGSFSMYLKNKRFINIEVAGKRKNASTIAFNAGMAEFALSKMGIRPISEYPTSVKNEAQKRSYLLGLFPMKGKDWMEFKVGREYTHLRREVAIAFTQMKIAAKNEGHELKLVSAYRSFEEQRKKWDQRMNFKGIRKFGEFKYKESPIKEKCDCPKSVKCICPPTIRPCVGILDEPARKKLEWDTANESHKVCWKTRLNDDDKVKEILKGYAIPGTSRHQWGTEIDLNSVTAEDWEKSPLVGAYGWLKNNASRFGFYQPYTSRTTRGSKGYPEEKWHWSYKAISEPLLRDYKKLLTGTNKTGFENALKNKGITGKELKAILDLYEEYVESVAESLPLPTPVPSTLPPSLPPRLGNRPHPPLL